MTRVNEWDIVNYTAAIKEGLSNAKATGKIRCRREITGHDRVDINDLNSKK